ncbi:MAG TPA: hypothetical protein VLQ93_10520 [Myxococcaceae bacterium]|nr:hypothetical protein [Myxococcaceae bacterium]
MAQLAMDFERGERGYAGSVASFTNALEQNPAPRRLGDVRLHYEPGRLVGESLPPSFWRRQLPGTSLLLAALSAAGAVVWVVVGGEETRFPVMPLVLGGLAASLVGFSLWLEGKLGRRRFVLHFSSERLRLEQLRLAPGATRAEWVAFDEVCAVEVVERAPRHYALVVAWRPEGGEETRRAVLVEHVRGHEEEALTRVWRLLHNAFGLRGAEPSGG